MQNLQAKTIVGRENETKLLDAAFKSGEAELIAVYGRRRVGKTYLIRNFYLKKKSVYFETTGIHGGSLKSQLERFAEEIGNTFYQGAKLGIPKTWAKAFDILTHAINTVTKQKVVIFLDELPWLATPRSGFIKHFEYFWNRYWSSIDNLNIIVCGSSASWIIKKIIKNKQGLHNRLTRKIRLLPFELKQTQIYLQHLGFNLAPLHIIKLYMCTGGIPFYLKQLQKSLSIDQNIDQLFFHANGIFFDEFDELFASLFKQDEAHKSLVKLIANRQQGMLRSDIAKHNSLKAQGRKLSTYLNNLEEAGFIRSFLPFQHQRRGLYYRISDEYCAFYLNWIMPIKPQLKQDPSTRYWQSKLNTPKYYSWQGYAFENICFKHLDQIKYALGVYGSALASPWTIKSNSGEQSLGAQIDLLLDRPDGTITLCEMKYKESPIVIHKDMAKNMLNKMKQFQHQTKTAKYLMVAWITPIGVQEGLYNDEIAHHIITLKDLFIDTYA